MGISHHRCATADNNNGTAIDKRAFVHDSTDEWALANQPTSHEARYIDVKGPTSTTDIVNVSIGDASDGSSEKPLCTLTTDSDNFVVLFIKQLLSINCRDLEQLTAVSRFLASLNASEDQWRDLWANQTFRKIINNCTVHVPAKQSIVNLLKCNETVRRLAPESVVAKFCVAHDGSGTDVKVPKQINSLSEVTELLQHFVSSGNVSAQFLPMLETSVNSNEQFQREMIAANAMMHWSPVLRKFVSPWRMDSVKEALSNIKQYESRTATKPPPALRHETTSPEPAACSFISFLGAETHKVTQTEYYRIRSLLSKPEVDETNLKGFIGKVLPYVLQCVKMRDCFILQPNRFSALVQRSQVTCASEDEESDPFSDEPAPSKAENKQYVGPVSRLDCLTWLLGIVESIVARDLLLVMSQFPMAFPLIMRDINAEGKYKLMTTLLRGIVVKWENASGKIIEHYLFHDPFKLLVAVRLGQNDTGKSGKSAILNQVLAKENTFSTRGEPGSEYGKPATVDGSVEFIWLTQETCKDTLWTSGISEHYKRKENTIILLANLHGDANEKSDVIALMSHCFQCRYLAFIMPSCSKNEWESFLKVIPSKDHVLSVRVDPADYNDGKLGDIQTSRIMEDTTLKKVRSRLDKALTGCCDAESVKKPTSNQCPRVSLSDGTETQLSQKIIDFVESSNCRSVKGHLQLQAARSTRKNIERTFTKVHDVVEQFIKILKSPDVTQRAVCLVHLENELSRLCNAETQSVRLEVSELKSNLSKAKVDLDGNPKDVDSTKRQVRDKLTELDGMNLGLEHLFREVGYLYELQLHNRANLGHLLLAQPHSKTNSDVLLLPPEVADLFLNGHPIELLDGDAGDIQMMWLNDIFSSVAKKYPKLRVYVISIIGLQSSGKSTLLNSLFACRFAVSVGRCTRGLFMRLLFLDEELAKDCKVDAILLVDTEGLGSPDKMGDVEAEKKDRLLATFAMGISNLAIVNVLGETMNELTEILQIAVVTMTRLEEADIEPDILLVQHLLTEKNSEKLAKSEEQFCEAIRNAIDLAEKKDVQIGVRNAKCLGELIPRIQNGTLLTQFHPYKDGATANAPASEAYHNDVVSLYQKILDCCKSSTSVIEFSKWKALLESYWECVTKEDFALRFKNVKEIHDFIDRGQRIAEVKQAIDGAFSAHAREMKETFVRELHDGTVPQNREDFQKEIVNIINSLPRGCKNVGAEQCPPCKEACERQKSLYEYVQEQPCETETQTTIDKFIKVVRESTVRKLSQSFDASVMQQGCYVEFDKIVLGHLRKHLKTRAAGEFSHGDRERIINEIFADLSKTARAKDHDVPVRHKIAEAIGSEYRQYPNILNRFNEEIKMFEDVFRSDEKLSASRSTGKTTPWRKFVNCVCRSEDEGPNIVEQLRYMTDSVLRKMLDQRQADCYEDGMIGQLNGTLTNNLDALSKRNKQNLDATVKLNIHVWTLQQFCKRMEDMQTAWDKKNKPTSILQENKERYKQMINARLERGFTCAAEGLIIGKHLLEVNKQKAIDAVNIEKILAVKGLVWTTNAEKVRLKYFKHLAEQVRDGKKDKALAHFQEPKKQIEAWYKRTVDEHRSESFRTTFETTFEQEFQSVFRKI